MTQADMDEMNESIRQKGRAGAGRLWERVASLEALYVEARGLIGEVLATLRLNEQYLFEGDGPAKEAFAGLLSKWEARQKALTDV